MSAWSFIEPVGAHAPKRGVTSRMRCTKGTHSISLLIYPDVYEEMGWGGGECFRVAIPAGQEVDRIRLIQDRTGPFELKESSRGTALRLSITGLEPPDGATWTSASCVWKVVEGDQLELILPRKVRRVGA